MSSLSEPSDAVAAKMTELHEERLEQERQYLESERQRLLWESARKKEYDEELVLFEANLRLCTKESGCESHYTNDWITRFPATKLLIQSNQLVYGGIEKAICAYCKKEFKYKPLKSISSTEDCSRCIDIFKIVKSIIDPIATAKFAKIEEQRRISEIEKATAAKKQMEITSSKYDKQIDEIVVRTSSINSCVLVLPRNSTCPLVTIVSANYGNYGGQMVLIVRKMDHRLDITVPLISENFIGKAPVEWNNAFEEGKLPCLTKCPVCGQQNTMWGAGNIGGGSVYQNGRVECNGHYSWDPDTNTHKKLHSEHGCMMKWDPLDPDGSIALAIAKEKRRQELLKELNEL